MYYEEMLLENPFYIKMKNGVFEDKQYFSRPAKTNSERLFKVSEYLLFYLEDKDLKTKEFKAFKKKNFKPGVYSNSSCNSLTLYKYISENLLHKEILNFDEYECLEDYLKEPFQLYLIEDLQEITIKTKRDEEATKREINKKIIDSFFLPSIKTILDKHGLQIGLDGKSIFFKDQKAFKEFISNTIKENIIKELEQLGLEVPLNHKWRTLNSYTTLFELDRIIVDQSKLKVN